MNKIILILAWLLFVIAIIALPYERFIAYSIEFSSLGSMNTSLYTENTLQWRLNGSKTVFTAHRVQPAENVQHTVPSFYYRGGAGGAVDVPYSYIQHVNVKMVVR